MNIFQALFCKKIVQNLCILFGFLVQFVPAKDEKDHQCLGHWSECKFKLVPIVCNHSGGRRDRTKKKGKKIPLCLFVFLFLLYLCMYILSIGIRNKCVCNCDYFSLYLTASKAGHIEKRNKMYLESIHYNLCDSDNVLLAIFPLNLDEALCGCPICCPGKQVPNSCCQKSKLSICNILSSRDLKK